MVESEIELMESLNPHLMEQFITGAKEKIANDPAAVQEALSQYDVLLQELTRQGQTLGKVKGEKLIPDQYESSSKETIAKNFRDKCVELRLKVEDRVNRTNGPMSADGLKAAAQELLTISEAYDAAKDLCVREFNELLRRSSAAGQLPVSQRITNENLLQ